MRVVNITKTTTVSHAACGQVSDNSLLYIISTLYYLSPVQSSKQCTPPNIDQQIKNLPGMQVTVGKIQFIYKKTHFARHTTAYHEITGVAYIWSCKLKLLRPVLRCCSDLTPIPLHYYMYTRDFRLYVYIFDNIPRLGLVISRNFLD